MPQGALFLAESQVVQNFLNKWDYNTGYFFIDGREKTRTKRRDFTVANRTIRIATRQSPLALWQAEHVAARLRQAFPGIETELVTLS